MPEELSIDSSHVKAHRFAAGGEGRVVPSDRSLVGRPHVEGPCLADDRGRPVAFALTPANRTIPYPIDPKAYARRSLIERLFGRLKNWRHIATRYDRLAQNYLAALALVAIASAWQNEFPTWAAVFS